MSLTSLERRSGRLPAELTSFVGRREELTEVGRLLERRRLVTLMGPGGVGKTRLAVHAATRARERFEHGVCFVDLSAVPGPGLLALAIAEALGLPDQSPDTLLDTLVGHLADRRMLLVLDTCEHLVDGCAMLAELLLRNAPGLRVLATSRQPLDITGEHTLMVSPLTRPEPAGRSGGQSCDSMTLFAERAEAVVPGWAVTDGNHDAVALLCHRLDGIPLAIELAAVQLRVLSVEQIVTRLDHRILQIRGRRSGLPRHQTLRAAVDWSHELCTPGERLLWARLSVFAGDFDLESAERVCADAELPAAEVFDLVAGLVAQSIVLRVDRDGAARYRMLDTIREYGAERLEARGETEQVRARAFHWFAGLIRRSAAELGARAQSRWLAWFHREQANVRAQFDYGMRAVDDDVLLRTSLAMGRILVLQGLIGEARFWAGRIIDERAPGPGPEWTEMLALTGWLATLQNDLVSARALLAQAEGRALAAGDDTCLGYVRSAQGVAAFYADDPAEAVRILGEATELHHAVGNTDVLVPMTAVFLALACLMCGDVDAAARHAEAVGKSAEAAGELWCRSYGLCVQGLTRFVSGDADGALAELRAGLRIKRDIQDRLGVTLSLDLVGGTLIAAGDATSGARLLGAADRLRSFTGTTLLGQQHTVLWGLFEQQAREALGAGDFEAAYRDGRALDVDAAVAEALGERPLGPAGQAPRAELNGAGGASPLTRRELEIAGLVAEGLTNRDIADRLVIAKRTVDSHVEHILAKLDFSSRTQIAAWVARR